MEGTTTANAGAKFAIGMLAGSAAVLLPRLLALLSSKDDAPIVFFPTSYWWLAAGVGVFLGLVMLVTEWRVAAKPKDTFMAALGIPAVLSGALGTASTAQTATQFEREAARLRQAVSEEQQIRKDGAVTTLQPIGLPTPPKPGPGASSSLGISLIAAAHAQERQLAQAMPDGNIRFGVTFEQPKYVVVLKQSANAEEAVRDAQRLQADLPAARPVRSDRGYLVVLDGTPMGETDALLAARQAKKINDKVQPRLLEVK